MKKIWLMMLMICSVCVFTACSDDDNGDPTPQNPVTGFTVPATAEIGAEVTVSGKGFLSSAELYLKSAANVQTKVTEADFTASGVTFRIPAELADGKYTLILKQAGEWTLGEITLTVIPMPITDLNIPAEAEAGMAVTIGGNGFAQNAKIYLQAEGVERTLMTISDRPVSGGVTFTVPATFAVGDYSLVLEQGYGEWTLGTLKVVAGPVQKRLKMMKYVVDMSELGGPLFETPCYMFYNGQGQLVKTATDGTGESVIYDFTYSENHIEAVSTDPENVYPFTFDLTDGRITGGSQTTSKTREYTWKYDEAGYSTGLYYKTNGDSYRAYNFENGNLISANGAGEFKYGQSDWKNNRYGMDIAPCIIFFRSPLAFGDNEFYAYVLGLCGKSSFNLPSSLISKEQTETGSVDKTVLLTYQYDADGYVTLVTFEGEMLPTTLVFEYEAMP